jgi:hypothetical protein
MRVGEIENSSSGSPSKGKTKPRKSLNKSGASFAARQEQIWDQTNWPKEAPIRHAGTGSY